MESNGVWAGAGTAILDAEVLGTAERRGPTARTHHGRTEQSHGYENRK